VGDEQTSFSLTAQIFDPEFHPSVTFGNLPW
jgi:hypothetical protein